MMPRRSPRPALDDRGPLRVLFVNTSLPVGGAETLLVNLVRKMDRQQFEPELCCLKDLGPLGDLLSQEIPAFSGLLSHKYDLRILPKLIHLLNTRRIDAMVTIGAGDKMFWGRLAAWLGGVPVILSALHSTGWPDVVNKPNRLLTPITDGFIAVAAPHAQYLVEQERFPARQVHVIHNGVDTVRFRPRAEARIPARDVLGIPLGAHVCGIVAALRPEKNHVLFLEAAALVRSQLPTAHFVIIGDGPLRPLLERKAQELGISNCVHFAGSRSDIHDLLPALDIFSLTSKMEANPVSILEAMACGVPVVAPRVGSIPQTVHPDVTGFLSEPGDVTAFAGFWLRLLQDSRLARLLGENGRNVVQQHWSLDAMVRGYQNLIVEIYQRKCAKPLKPETQDSDSRQSAVGSESIAR